MKQSVLFICTHNAVRSQMAEGLLNALYPNQYQALSAGIVKTGVDTTVIRVLKEIGIDISHQYSKTVHEFRGKTFDYVVTLCENAKEACPFFPGKTLIHQPFYDPGTFYGPPEERLDKFRASRDEIKAWIIKTFGTPNRDINHINLGGV